MTKCCGKDRDTMFCPECGSQLRDAFSLCGLLRHCHTTANAAEKGAATREHRDEGLSGDMARRYIKSGRRTAAKWRSWADQLERLLDAGGGKD